LTHGEIRCSLDHCGCQDHATIVRLELRERHVFDTQTSCQFGHGHRIHLRRFGAAGDDGRHPPQRGLLTCQRIGLAAPPLGFGGAQTGLPCEDVGQQRQGQEYEQCGRHPVHVEVEVDQRARDRGGERQPEVPARGHDEHPEQEDGTEGVLGRHPGQHQHQGRLGHQ
jgi:hypothetical protein